MSNEFENLVGIADFIVVPGNNLNEGVGKSDTSLGIEDGGVSITEEIGGYNSFISVAENTLEFAFRSSLHGIADLLIGSRSLEVNGEVNYRNVKGRNAHGHAGQLAVEFRNNLAYSLGSAGGGRNDVASSCTTAAPILERRTVNSLLSGSGGMNGGHEAIGNAELVVKNLGDRSQTVGGAGSVGNELGALFILVEVNAANEHRGVVLGRSGHNNVLSASVEVSLSLFLGEEETGGFNYVFSANFVPLEFGRILNSGNANATAVNDELALFHVSGNFVIELAVHGVELEHVSKIVNRAEVVDAYNFDVVAVFNGSTENETADTAKTINTNFDLYLKHLTTKQLIKKSTKHNLPKITALCKLFYYHLIEFFYIFNQ